MAEPTQHAAASGPHRSLTLKLLAVVVLMFGFGFALVPLYDAFCAITGLNGKTGRIDETLAVGTVDKGRWVTVEFLTNVNSALPWKFWSAQQKMRVHPGEVNETLFYSRNLTQHSIVGQAVPSVAPGKAARYFNKTECFCFTQQQVAAGETKEMPVRFIVDANLPEDVNTISLAYTFFPVAPENVATADQSLAGVSEVSSVQK
jgi:cytochrome c oxidase assembly protein subunit 11